MTASSFISSASSTGARVQNAIASAATATGVDFSYLYHQAKIESGFNPNAQARTSSATGLYQFVENSWLGTVKKHGAEHGLAWAADSITLGRDGRYHAGDAATRQAILALRSDPEASAKMAAEYASDNKDYLQRKLGREVESVDLYMAHFLGPAGARRFLTGMDANPDGSAADVVPAAARANRSIFYDRAGNPRSFAAIRQKFAAKFESETPAQGVPDTKAMPQVQMASLDALNGQQSLSQQLITPSPQYARLAYLMLANLGA
jgi:hypothetical protein